MEPEPVAPRWRRLAREALPVLVLLAVCAKSLAGGLRTTDLITTDEAIYVGLAWFWSDPTVPPPKQHPMYAPLYVAWYRLLMLLPVGPEFLPSVNYGLLMTALALLFHALARRLGAGRWVAATAASAFILNTRFAAVTPLPVHFATALLAAGVLVGTYRRSALAACGPVGFAALAACYIRHEFGTVLLALVPVYLAAGAWACRHAVGRRAFLPWAAPLLVSIGTCATTIGLPLPDGPRGLVAFAQHYAMNVAQVTGQGADLWTFRFREVLVADFGEVQTVGEAVRARPGAVAWHVGRNLDRLPGVVCDLLQPRMELAPIPRKIAHGLLLAAAGAGLLGAFRRVWAGGLRGPSGQPLRAWGVAVPLVGAISGGSVVLIFPREHYLILPLFFLLVLAAGHLPAPRWPTGLFGEPTRAKLQAVGCASAVLLLTATPTATHRWTLLRPLATKWPTPVAFPQRETMTLLRESPVRPPTVVLEHHDGVPMLTAWMARPLRLVSAELKTEGFRAFVARHNIGVVILDSRLRADPRFAGDPEFLELWDETDPGAFAILTAPGGRRVAIRRDRLVGE